MPTVFLPPPYILNLGALFLADLDAVVFAAEYLYHPRTQGLDAERRVDLVGGAQPGCHADLDFAAGDLVEDSAGVHVD